MRRVAVSSLLAVALLLAAVPSDAWSRHGHFHHPRFHTSVFIGVGPAFWWGPPYPYWWYPPPYYVYAPPPVIVQEPPVYIQPPPPPPAPPGAEAYWYYCSSAQVYYPNVATCPEPWVRVTPRAP